MGAIVVVGGGVAGLTCAWRLQRAGHDVEVLERASAPGGRMRSERHGDYVVDRGAQFVTSGFRNLHAVVEAVGIADRVRAVPQKSTATQRDGLLHSGDFDSPARFLTSPLLSWRTKVRLPRILIDLWRHQRVLDPYRPERAAAIDAGDLASHLRRTLGDEALEYLFAPAFSSAFHNEPEDLSAVFGMMALQLFASGFQLQTFDGGIGLLTRTLAERVPVRLGCEVLAVETETEGARVRYRAGGRERKALADAVVIALPGDLVTSVCPKLTPAERAFFEEVRYSRGTMAYLLLESAPRTLPFYGVSFPRRERVGLYGVGVDHHKPGAAPPGAGLLSVTLAEGESARLWNADESAVVEHVLERLERTPLGRLAPVGAVVHRFDPMLPRFRAGYARALARFFARTDCSPRLAFAGDYLLGPHAEGALTSGLRAAHQVSHALDVGTM